jgi:hypothetical protein|tara:strand:- start:30 stop:212 length:183 start_codon:yes stop_codon:yes gene_type:complete
MKWMLVLVFAVGPGELDYKIHAVRDTIAECYFEKTMVDWEKEHPANQDAFCIRVTEENLP